MTGDRFPAGRAKGGRLDAARSLRGRIVRAGATALAVLLPLAAAAGEAPATRPADTSYTYGIGEYEPHFTPPQPGSYELPAMGAVQDHPLVDAAGQRTTLAQLTGDRFAVVSFIYGTCSEAAGCPLSNAVLQKLDARVTADPALSRQVQLVTVSFDPARDTPARLAELQTMRAAPSSWRFVTSPSEPALDLLLGDFGQTVSKLYATDGSWTGAYRHVLKVFLLDRQRGQQWTIRNIYSVGFLDTDLLMADLRTLAMAAPAKAGR